MLHLETTAAMSPMEDKYQIIAEANKHWEAEQPLRAGQLIFEHIPRKKRPRWVAEILELVHDLIPPSSTIKAILDFAYNDQAWGKIPTDAGQWNPNTIGEDRHRKALLLVSFADDLNLPLPHRFYESISELTRNAGKVIYNARWYPAPFDHDAGWKIAVYLKQLIEEVDDQAFAEKAWMILSNPEYVEVIEPIICHPDCPTCHRTSF